MENVDFMVFAKQNHAFWRNKKAYPSNHRENVKHSIEGLRRGWNN
jgi:hypothetical protein